MNQVNNLIQWKNLTEEQKSEFDFDYKYEFQGVYSRVFEYAPGWEKGSLDEDCVYRLVIEPEKWYYVDSNRFTVPKNKRVLKGIQFSDTSLVINDYTIIRPAKTHEIPKQEKTLEERIKEKWPDKEVVILKKLTCGKHNREALFFGDSNNYHLVAQSIIGFYKYVYEHRHDDGNIQLISTHRPTKRWKGKTILPVAGLFEERVND